MPPPEMLEKSCQPDSPSSGSVCRRIGPACVAALFAGLSFAASAVTADDGGAVELNGVPVPLSVFASPESAVQFQRSQQEARAAAARPGIEEKRAFYDASNSAIVERMRKLYPVTTRERRYGGVLADVVEPQLPADAERDPRVLINLHGGAFLWGARSGALVEAIPVASVSGITVVAVDYRMGPEHVFPAASEDVETVYRELLKSHRAEDIGIYGCSAGGYLAAQAVARLIEHELPLPGAIGTLCGSLLPPDGDSIYTAAAMIGQPVPEAPPQLAQHPYFKGASIEDPLAFPGNHPQYAKRFPPTLLITGTRDFALSSVARSHAVLVQNGVEADLHVYEGMSHAFFIHPELPESQAAYKVIADFFRRHLGDAGQAGDNAQRAR